MKRITNLLTGLGRFLLFEFDKSKSVPPPPPFVYSGTERDWDHQDDRLTATASGEMTVRTGQREDGNDWKVAGAMTKHQIKSLQRDATFNEYDRQVLDMPKFAKLSVEIYKQVKPYWAEGVSAKAAGDHGKLSKIPNFGKTTRTPYWTAMNLSHRLQAKAQKEAAATPLSA